MSFDLTINLPAGESMNVGVLFPAESTTAKAEITSGEARLNGTISTLISWVPPNPLVMVEAISDCVIYLSDAEPVQPEPGPRPF